MSSELPRYHDTFNYILKELENKIAIESHELADRVSKKYYSDLPIELKLQKTSSGANSLLDRINRGKSYLKIAKFLWYPKRGMVQITEKGVNQIKKGPIIIQDIRNDKDFIEHISNSKKIGIENSEIDRLTTNDSPQDLIDNGYKIIKNGIKNDLLEKLKNTNPYYFEKVILLLLNKMGYGSIIETPKSNDGGIDGIINEDKLGLEKIYIQAKRFNSNKVREPDIRNFIGAMNSDTRKGIFVTTSTFDEGAIKKAYDSSHTIILIDGIMLVDLLYEYDVGVQTRQVYNIKDIDEDFFISN